MNDEIGLVHMNGRIYDPVIAKFLTPDPFIQAPREAASYNRYAYVTNNPLAYTDPSGYFSIGGVEISPRAIARSAGGVFTSMFNGGSALATAMAGGFAGGMVGTGTLSAGVHGLLDIARSDIGQIAIVVAAAYFGAPYLAESLAASGADWAVAASWEASEFAAAGATLTTAGSATVGAGVGFTVGVVNGGSLQSGIRGAASGAILGGVDGYFGQGPGIQRAAARVAGSGVAARLQGGTFREGFLSSTVNSAARYLYLTAVGYDVNAAPGENRPGAGPGRQTYRTDEYDRLLPQDQTMNIIGFNERFDGSGQDFFRQGGALSRALNMVPGINAIGGMDDYLNNISRYGDTLWLKGFTIPTSVFATVPALMDRVPAYHPTYPFGRGR